MLLWGALVTPGFAGDWPEIHGPSRNGRAAKETLASSWEQPPTQIWAVRVGQGYAGPAVANGSVFVFHRQQDANHLDCLSNQDGAVRWSVDWRAKYRGGIDADKGPRCVPLVRDGRVYVMSPAGELHCVDLQGKKIWSRNLGKDFRAQDGYFGFGSTPLVAGNTVMVNIGSRKGAAVVAVDAKTGVDRWQQFNDSASYSAPIAWNVAGQNCAVFITRLHLIGLAPSDGRLLFQTPFGATGPTVNAAAPVVVGENRLFLTASYRIGAKLVEIKSKSNGELSTQQVWASDEAMSSQYPTPIFDDGYLYGVHGREDGPAASLRCIEAATGKVQWSHSNVGMAHLILADNKLLMLTVDGDLALLEKSPKSYRERGRIEVASASTRALPALSNRVLFVRNTDGELTAWQLP